LQETAPTATPGPPQADARVPSPW